jgi:hypothetical protein
MTAINKAIPRGLQVIFIMAIFAVLIWKFAFNTDYYYYSIGAAVVLTIALALAIYHAPVSTSDDGGSRKQKVKSFSEAETEASEEELETGEMALEAVPADGGAARPAANDRGYHGFKSVTEKPDAHDVAIYYFRMAAIAKARDEEANTWRPKPKTIEDAVRDLVANKPADEPVETDAATEYPPATEDVESTAAEATDESLTEPAEATETEADASAEPKMPLVVDETVLTELDKSELENAVWYRCENPYCKYTHFLDVHHIVDEKDGGTNKLENLVVLCPYCHELAHKNEIPVEEMKTWVANREERFKFKLQWRYY